MFEFWNIDIASSKYPLWENKLFISTWFQLNFKNIQIKTIYEKLNFKFQAD